MVALEDLQRTVGRVAESVGPVVVGVGHRSAIGSGVVVAPGKVLTNAHNIRRDEVTVTFNDGRTATGRADGVDAEGDLAVLSVDTADAPAITWPESPNGLGIGAPVLALSNPGGRGLRVTFGLVSGTERTFRGPRGHRITGSLEHTAPLLPGSSGGPTVDAGGNFLGINTNRLGEGFYLAIPADSDLRRQVDALSKGDSPARPRLGVALAPSDVAKNLRRAVGLPEAEGLLIRGVEDDGPAAQAGLREGDLILEAAGRATVDVDELQAALQVSSAGSPLDIKFLRGTEERSVTVTPAA
ncbi:MAG: trypsin-like peptidase domain-containing protein [Actinobacteria bacterium]|nr:trypsin-like peptidase domain-containing protein [Actinomycetota bacterium]